MTLSHPKSWSEWKRLRIPWSPGPLVAVAKKQHATTRRRSQPSAPLRSYITTRSSSFIPPTVHHANDPIQLASPNFSTGHCTKIPGDMAFKRKRSVDDSPLSVSSYGAVATPEAQSPTPSPHAFGSSMDMDEDSSSRHNGWDFASANRVKTSDWGNRTRKRFRDNRPDERAIHGMTAPCSDICRPGF